MKHEPNRYPLIGFSERLKQARHDRGLSQRELGNRVKISRESIRGYESGYLSPHLTIAAKLAAELSVSLDWLAYGREAKKK